MRRTMLVSGSAFALGLAGCATPKGETTQERRQYVHETRDEALADLYREVPDARNQIANAAGYGVFSNIGTNVIFVETGGGFGIVRDNKSGEDTYMKMGSLGVGLGIGVTDFRAVFVFKNEAVLRDFVDDGYQFGAKAQAAAKSGDQGGAATATGEPGDDIIVYQFTKNGVVASATVQGTKYWKDDALDAK